MDNNLKEQILDLKIKFNRARFNLMFMVVLTIINIYLILANGSFQMPFSCSIATFSVAFQMESIAQEGIQGPPLLGLILAAILLIALLICYFKSKTNVIFLVATIGIIVIDTFALMIISLFTGAISTISFFLDLVFHLLSVYYLVKGIKAYKQLGTFKESVQTHESDNNECDTPNIEYDQPLCKYIDNGAESLLSGSYNGLNVFVVRNCGVSELVVNGYVCDRLESAMLFEYELTAIVNEICFIFQYSKDIESETMFLYADDILLDCKRII